MSANNGDGSNSTKPAPQITWGTKVSYIGTGVLIGLIAYPFVRKALTKIQPKMDGLFDDLTGKAEEYAEKASDLLAKAKHSMNAENGRAKRNGHSAQSASSDHDHDHDHDHNNA
jgi:ABC-type Zn2+ transport system substrate-binding protein/surface adhesin